MADLPAAAKRAAERLMVRSGLAEGTIRRRADSVAILMYHNIVPKGEAAVGERSLHLPVTDFADQLDRLCESHEVVSLEHAFEEAERATKPRAVLTFDDAYAGAIVAGGEELRKRGLTATAFLNPGCLGGDGFWWDLLSDPDTGTVSEAVRRHALEALGGATDRVLEWAASRGLAVHALPEYARPIPAALLVSTKEGTETRPATPATFSYGSHTWSHTYLPALDVSVVEREIQSSWFWLQERLDHPSPWLSYPYGGFSEAAGSVAARCHAGGLLVSGGRAPLPLPTEMRYRTPRINVPSGVSVDGFVLRLAGLVG